MGAPAVAVEVDEDNVPDSDEKKILLVWMKMLIRKKTIEVVCAFCKRSGPTKRCAKRHPKCLKKMFCNESCEALAHEDKKTAVAKKEAAGKAAAAKKLPRSRTGKIRTVANFGGTI